MAKTYDPFKNVQDVMTKAMEIGHIDTTMFEIIKNPQRETKVYLPVEMDDGTVKVFEGYRKTIKCNTLYFYKRKNTGEAI